MLEGTGSRLRPQLPLIAATAVLTLLAWPFARPDIGTGLDPSWQAGLHMAFRDQLAFGDEVIYTYGPLGFLVAPKLYFVDTWAPAVAVTLAASTALGYAVLRLLHRVMNMWWALAVAVPLMLVLTRQLLVGSPGLPAVCLILATLWALRRLQADPDQWHLSDAVVPGAASAVVLLIKLDVGPACTAVLGWTVGWCAARAGGWRLVARHVTAFAAAAVATVVLIWIGIGQPVDALPRWISRSFDVITGYSAALGIESGGAWEYAAALLAVGALAAAVVSAWQLPRLDRGVLLGVLAIVSFVVFKQGFVRHDGHSVQFFAMFTVLPLAFLPLWGARQGLLLMIGPFVALLAVANIDVVDLVAPRPRVEATLDVVRLAVSDHARVSFIEETRARLRDEYALPDALIERVEGRTVHLEPWELTLAYAYPELRWRQSPVFQAPNAFTSSLDRLDAEFLSGPDRPDFVLREPGVAIDGRLSRFESPEAELELLCRYREVHAGERWQLLEAGRDRCGQPRVLEGRQARFGERVDVPPARDDSLVVARIRGIDDTPLDALRNLLYKAPEVYLRDANGTRIRFLQGHQGSMHILSVPECAVRQLDGPNVLRFDTLEFEDRDAESYDIEFLRVPFSC